MMEQRIDYIHNNLAKRSHEALASNPVEDELVLYLNNTNIHLHLTIVMKLEYLKMRK